MENSMEVFLVLCRACIIFISFSYFIFGNAYWGVLDGTQVLGGIVGMAVGILGGPISKGKKFRPMVVISLCYAVLLFISYDLFHYYRENAFPGSYDWEQVGPLCLCLLVIMLQFTINNPSNQQPKPTP